MKKNKPHQARVGQLAPVVNLLFTSILIQSWLKAHYEIIPDLTLAAIYYWSIFRPSAILIVAIFVIGIIEDCLSNTLLGFNSCLWLILYLFVLTQRRFFLDKNFLLVWSGFMFCAAVIFILKWGAINYLHTVMMPFKQIFFSYLLSIGFYPFIARLLGIVSRY